MQKQLTLFEKRPMRRIVKKMRVT